MGVCSDDGWIFWARRGVGIIYLGMYVYTGCVTEKKIGRNGGMIEICTMCIYTSTDVAFFCCIWRHAEEEEEVAQSTCRAVPLVTSLCTRTSFPHQLHF